MTVKKKKSKKLAGAAKTALKRKAVATRKKLASLTKAIRSLTRKAGGAKVVKRRKKRKTSK